MDSKFICLNCGFRDTGNYCSNCSNELKINPLLIHALISNRLKRVGFLSFNDVPNLNVVGVLYLSELAELVERSLKRPQDILLLEQRTGGSLLFEGLILIEGDENNLDIEKLFHLKDILFKNIEERRAKLKMQGVNNISLKILLSYKMPLSNRQMSLIKGNSRTIRFPPCRYTHVSTTAIILAERKLDMNFYTYLLYPYYRQIDFALKQIELSSPINTEPSDALYSFLIDSISLITQPILDYLEGLSMITKTAFLAKLIEEGEIDAFRASTLVKYMVGAVVVSAIISAFFDVGIISLGIPVIDEIINISVFLLEGLSIRPSSTSLLELQEEAGFLEIASMLLPM